MTRRYKPSEQPKGWARPKKKKQAKTSGSSSGTATHEVTMGGTVGPSSAGGGGGHEVTMGGEVRPPQNTAPAAPKPKKKRMIQRSVLGEQAHDAAVREKIAARKVREASPEGKASNAELNRRLDAVFDSQSQQNQDAASDAARSTATHKYQTIRGNTQMTKQPKDPGI